jgi:Rv0623-like transcription factor
MTAPQLSVRSAKARDLAHELSAREKRPIHAIVEDALVEYAKRYPKESTEAFLRRIRTISAKYNLDEAMVEVEASIEQNRKPHRGIDL